jgi:hypothetical protein
MGAAYFDEGEVEEGQLAAGLYLQGSAVSGIGT